MRYIELNPVRAGMVDHPGACRWSSYRCNAQGEADELIQPHAVFTALDADPRIRAERYRGVFQNALAPGEADQIRAGTNCKTRSATIALPRSLRARSAAASRWTGLGARRNIRKCRRAGTCSSRRRGSAARKSPPGGSAAGFGGEARGG